MNALLAPGNIPLGCLWAPVSHKLLKRLKRASLICHPGCKSPAEYMDGENLIQPRTYPDSLCYVLYRAFP